MAIGNIAPESADGVVIDTEFDTADVPFVLAAVTVKAYDVDAVNPVNK